MTLGEAVGCEGEVGKWHLWWHGSRWVLGWVQVRISVACGAQGGWEGLSQ